MKFSFTPFPAITLVILAVVTGGCSPAPSPNETPPVAPTDAAPPTAPAPMDDSGVEAEDPFAEFEVESEDVEAAPTFDTTAGIQIDPKARLPKFLGEYGLFADPAKQIPNEGLIPYDLNTGHFADNANVSRFLWLPPGEKIGFHATDRFTFPVGTALIQTFAFPVPEDESTDRLVETRVLLNQPGKGWTLSSYKWDESNGAAKKALAGGLVPVRYNDPDDGVVETNYLIPNKNDCMRCHENEGTLYALGLTARNLNRDVDYGAGPTNQLAHWIESGVLEGAPEDLATVDQGPEWDNPDTGTVTERARMWLDVNCAHCHNPKGAGNVSGLDLTINQQNPVRYGAYKPPVAAGRGSEGLRFSIEPGLPENSFLIRRLRSTDPSIMMPPLGRMSASKGAEELISAWIASLSFTEEEAKEIIAEQEANFKLLQEKAALEGVP